MSHLQQESHPGHELSTYEELPVYNYSTEIEELSMAVEISKYKEPSVPEELSVYKPLPVNQVLPVSEEALPPPPPLWTLRVLYLCGILAVIGVALMLFEIALGMFPIMIHVIRSLFGESTCDGYTANEWYKGGYDVVYNEALATASNNKYATIKRRHKSDTPTIVEIPGLPATVPVSARCETPENKLHTQDQGEEVSPTTVVGTTDIMAKDSILEESGLTENELQLEGREDINPQEKKEEGLPPPYARMTARTDTTASMADMDIDALRRWVDIGNMGTEEE
ncbi:hypothetical protein PENANT_c002G07570 [Penicillium antarcticum]|uniref:Uncharacterized protein n=1 Tax=Penicillium antarcticum TaxID=416450 RepID=A0A1V6QKS3_9EURO|nr:hypothetical protein PENANT_c002G07570 [Penicillium antarcticum]